VRRAHDRTGFRETVDRILDLRDAEVGENRPARLVVKQDVRGLDVAVDHAVPVCPLERVRELDEDPPNVARGQRPFEVQAVRERLPANVAHHEIPDAVDLPEAVQRENAGVRELGGDPRLTPEPRATLLCLGEIGPQDLHGDEPLERPIAGEIDGTHAADPEPADDLVLRPERALDGGAQHGIAFRHEALAGGRDGGPDAGKAVPAVGCGEQGFGLFAKLAVIAADRGEVVLAVRDGTFQRAGDDRLDLRPALGRHGVPSSRRSHARATAHSRLIVAGERPSASAVSSMVIPPK